MKLVGACMSVPFMFIGLPDGTLACATLASDAVPCDMPGIESANAHVATQQAAMAATMDKQVFMAIFREPGVFGR